MAKNMSGKERAFKELWCKLETVVKPKSPLRLRLYRSLSWLERADAEDDADAKYMFLWVAFNAAYAMKQGEEKVKEWELYENYLSILTRLVSPRLHGTARTKLREPIISLMNNEYVFWGFWDSVTDETFDWEDWRWKRRFENERDTVQTELGKAKGTNTFEMLTKVFARLYELRNQLMHGCATQHGSLNRRQVRDGAAILSVLVPLFLDIMMDHCEEDWGKISYPVRDDIREDLVARR